MFTMFTMFIYITIMMKSYIILLIISGLFIAFNACTSIKNPNKKDIQEHEVEKRQEDFDEHYDNNH